MAPNPQRPRRTGAAAYLPLVSAVCAILLVRGALGALASGWSSWLQFVVALAVGWLAYVGVERLIDRRGKDSSP